LKTEGERQPGTSQQEQEIRKRAEELLDRVRGHDVSDQTVGNVLERHGLGPAPKRSQTIRWKDFIALHMSVMAGMDFFTVEVLHGVAWQPISSSS